MVSISVKLQQPESKMLAGHPAVGMSAQHVAQLRTYDCRGDGGGAAVLSCHLGARWRPLSAAGLCRFMPHPSPLTYTHTEGTPPLSLCHRTTEAVRLEADLRFLCNVKAEHTECERDGATESGAHAAGHVVTSCLRRCAWTVLLGSRGCDGRESTPWSLTTEDFWHCGSPALQS